MAKKSFSTKKNLKSLFSKSEANLEESANDASGGDGGKTLKLFKWKKKKKTEPEADKTEEKIVSQTELDGSGTGLDRDGVSSPKGGGRKKKLTLYGTTPRSKKGLLSSSETDLRKPKKFGTFSFSWKKKSKQHADNPSHNATVPDAPRGLEEEEDLEGSVEHTIDLTDDPENATERRVRFELSEPKQPGPQVTLSPPSGPPDQSKPDEVVTISLDVPDGGVTQDLAPSAPDAVSQTSGVAPLRVDGEEGQEVQVNGADDPALLPSAHEGALVPAASAAYAALTRAVTLRGGLPATPPASPSRSLPSVGVTPDTNFPLPGTDLPHDDTSHLKNEISEKATPMSALSEPGTSDTDLSIPKTQLSDIPIPNSDLSVAVVKETDTSLPNSDLPESIGALSKTSLLNTDLSDAVALPNADTFVPKTEVCDTVSPDADTSLPNTDLSDSTASNTDTSSAKIEVPDTDVPGTDISLKSADVSDTVALNSNTSLPNSTDLNDNVAPETDVTGTVCPDTDTSLKNTDLSDTISPSTDSSLTNIIGTVAPSTTTSLPNTDLSNTIDLITDTPLPNTDMSVTFDSSLPKNEISSIAASDTDISDTDIPNIDPIPNTDLSDSTAPNTDTSIPNTDSSSAETPLPNTSLAYTDLSDALSHDIDSILPKTEISNTAALDPSSPNSDLSDTTAPNTDTSTPLTDPSGTTDTSIPITDLSDTTAPNTDTSIPNTDTSSPKTPPPNTSLAYTDLSDALSRDIDSILPKTEISNTAALDPGSPSTDLSIPNTDLSDTTAPNTDTSIPITDLSVTTAPNTDTSSPNIEVPDTDVPGTDISLKTTEFSESVLSNTDSSSAETPLPNSSLAYTDLSDALSHDIDSILPKTEISNTAAQDHGSPNSDLSDTTAPNTDTSIPITDLSDTSSPNTDTSIPITDLSDTTGPKTDTSIPITDLFDTTAPNTDTSPKIEVPDTDVPGTDISLKNTEFSDALAPNTEVTDNVTAYTDTPFRTTDLSATNSIHADSSPLNTDLSDTVARIMDSSLLNTDLSNSVTPDTDICPLNTDLSDLPSPGLSVSENLNPFCPSAQDLEGSRPDTPDQVATIVLTMGIPDTISDRQEARMQEDEMDRGLAAEEMGRLGGGGREPSGEPSPEPVRRDPQENGAGDIMKVAPPLQEEDQEGQGKTDVPYQECKDGGLIEEKREELEQWKEEGQRWEEMEEKVIEKGPAGILKLDEVTVEGQDGEEVKKALTEEEEGGRGVQAEDFEVMGQKEWVKEEMEEVEQRSQLPAMEPDSPVRQECMAQKCEPAPPSPTTEGEGLPLNRGMATEKQPCVLVSEEQTPERADCWATNIHNSQGELILTDTGADRAHTLTDTGTDRAHTLTDHTSAAHMLADSATERADSTHTSTLCDTPARTEDPLPSLSPVSPAERVGRFLDDLSGPWAAVEECLSPGIREDPDTMNSGYGVLSTTLSLKRSPARDVKEDGLHRFRKLSLVSSSEDPGEDFSSSPAAAPYDYDRAPAGTEGQREVLSREDRPAPGEVTPRSSPQFGSESLGSLNSYYSPAFLDTQYLFSPGTNQEAGLSAPSPEKPGSHSNSHSFSERSEVQWSWERELGGWDRAEPAAPAEERAREGGINSGSDSRWLSDRSLSPTQTEVPLSGLFKATRVDLLPSPTSPDISSPHDMDNLVDTLKSMEPPQRQRVSRPPPLSAITSLPPIVEDSPVQAPRAQNGTGSLPQDLGLKRSSPKDMPTPLEMMKRQHEVDGPRSLPLRASADSSIVFRKSSPGGGLSPDGSSSPQLNGSSSPSPSRLEGSLLFSGYRLENGKPQAARPLARASSLPDAGPSMDRMSSAPGQPGPEPPGSSRYERFSFLMSPTSSLAEAPEPLRVSRPPALTHSPLGELGFTHSPLGELGFTHSPLGELGFSHSSLGELGLSHRPSSPLDLLHSPSTDPHGKLQRSLSVDSPLAKMGSQFTPQPEPERPAVIKYRAFPDAYRTKEKEHGKLNPRPGKMLIFTEPGLSGERIEIRSDVIDATPWDLPETIYIRVVRGGWVLYEKPNFKGGKVALDEGDIELTSPFRSPEEEQKKEGGEEEKSQPSRKCVFGSLRRAVRDYSVPEISLFPEENAEGKKVIFRDTSEDARIFGFPIKAKSIIIKAGLWLVYAHPFMEGAPRVLEVGGYPNPASWGVTQPYVGSLHPLKIGEPRVEKPNEPKLVIFDKSYFSGKSRDVYTHLRDFITRTDMKQTAFMHNAGSIRVTGGCWVGFSKENFRGHQYLLEEGDYHDWRVWGGCDSELRSVRLIRADFAEPALVMFSRPDEEDEDQEEKTFEVTEAIPDVEPFNFPTSTHSIHVLNGAWIAYSHVDFSGDQYILEKGFYSNCGDWGATDNRICSIQPILPAPSETPTSRSQVLLYSEPDFQGQCQLCLKNEESLPEKFLTKSCRVLRGSWVVYEGREYSGGLYILPEGDYPNLDSMGCPPSCSLRSLKIIPLMFAVPSISLFGLECFEGREVTLDSEVPSLVDEGFNNHVLSIRVNSGCWVVCEHTNYRGRQILLEPIEIPNWLKFSGLSAIGSMHAVRQKRHFFRIKNQERGHVMSIQGGVEEMKSGRVVVTEQVEGMSDVWYYQDGLIKNKLAPNMCLQVMGEVEPGAKVVLWSETRQPTQIWTTQASGIIRSLTFPGMVLDIKGGKAYDRNHVIIHGESEERPSQQWNIELL
ncbi:uncharacterized protein crybg2 isoform X3 [Anguilla rostrata]|uniref:uncharacterized protein crybg2 isoform X3 n=1 Tax=Anguilla rostrata TaxID=7938 RepID=UPI0030CCB3AE